MFVARLQHELSGPWTGKPAPYGDFYDLWKEKTKEHTQKMGKEPPKGVFEKETLARCYDAAGRLSELATICQIQAHKKSQASHPVLADRFNYFKKAFHFIYSQKKIDKNTADAFLSELRNVKTIIFHRNTFLPTCTIKCLTRC